MLDKKNEEWETEEISMLQTIMKYLLLYSGNLEIVRTGNWRLLIYFASRKVDFSDQFLSVVKSG